MSVTFKRVDSDGVTIKDSGLLGRKSSISPVTNTELLTEEVLQRPTDNLRVRSEELARAIESTEYIIQSATNSSKVLRYVIGSESYPGLLKVFSQTFDSTDTIYYFFPEVPAGVASATFPSLVVLGSATNSFNYILNKEAIEAFYSTGVNSGYNRYLGLKNVGDSICLRIPTVSSSYSSETLLPRTTSSLAPAGEAIINANLAEALRNGTDAISAAEASYSLIKIPAQNSIYIVPTDTTLREFMSAQMLTIDQDKSSSTELYIQGLDGSPGSKIPLDLNGLEELSEGKYRIPRAGYKDFEGLSTEHSIFGIFIGNSPTPSETFSSGSAGLVFLTDTMLPKNEYMYPLAVFSGDAVLFPGLGGVSLIDLETRDGEAFIDGSGVVIGETGTATEIYNTRCRVTYENASTGYSSTTPAGINEFMIPSSDGGFNYLRVPINTLVTEAGIGAQLHLTNLSMQVTLDEEYAAQASGISTSVLRDVYISIGMFDLSSDVANYTSTAGVKFSLLKCVPDIPTNSQFNTGAVPKLILSNFRLKDLEDDYYADIKLNDSIKSTVATAGQTRLVVWIYRLDEDKGSFFTNKDSGSFNLEFNMSFSSRLGDTVNLGSQDDLLDYLK